MIQPIDSAQEADDSTETPRLAPLSVAELIDGGITLYRRNFSLLFLISLLVTSVTYFVSLLMYAFINAFTGGISGSAGTALLILAFVVYWLLVMLVLFAGLMIQIGATLRAVSERYFGHPSTIMSSIRFTLGKFWNLLGATVLEVLIFIAASIASMLIFIFLLVGLSMIAAGLSDSIAAVYISIYGFLLVVFIASAPFLIVFLGLLFVSPAVVLEGAGPFEAIRRSWRLVYVLTDRGWVRNNAVRATVVLTVVSALGFSMAMVQAIPAWAVMIYTSLKYHDEINPFLMQGGFGTLAQVLIGTCSLIVQSAWTPAWVCIITLFYYDLRVRREGLDLELRRRKLERLVRIKEATA